MLLEGIVSFKLSSYARANVRITIEKKKKKQNSHESIMWSEMGKQNIQGKEVYCSGSLLIQNTNTLQF